MIDPLKVIGKQLKALRKEHYPNDNQDSFAVRIGVSRGTYHAMETGTGKVAFASYMAAMAIYGLEDEMLKVFTQNKKSDLFSNFSRPEE